MRLCRSCTVKLLLTSLLSVYAISFLVLFFFSSDLTTTDNCNYSQKLVKEKTKQVVYIPFDGYDVPGEDLLLAHSASFDQLKKICSALVECRGFNSHGWLKKNVKKKKIVHRSILYVKQFITLQLETQTSTNSNIHGDALAGVFQSRLHDYTDMETKMSIYIYNTGVGKNMPSWNDYKYGVEMLFIQLLFKSRFRTFNPDKANFFFIPTRCTAYRKSVKSLQEGLKVAMLVTKRMVEEVIHHYPYWNASLGSDHFYICAHDVGTAVTTLTDRGLFKNAIALVNTADSSEEFFVPHKDISVPPHPGRGGVGWHLIGQAGAGMNQGRRNVLLFYAGNVHRGSVRPKLMQLFGNDSDITIIPGQTSEQNYIKHLRTSKFCLCPRGNKAWSPRVMDAVWFGCIPVFLADHYHPPLHGLVDWDQLAVSVPERELPDLKNILKSITAERVMELQHNIQKVTHHLTWNDPPLPYDAFHSVLYELWQHRKNIVRTLTARYDN